MLSYVLWLFTAVNHTTNKVTPSFITGQEVGPLEAGSCRGPRLDLVTFPPSRSVNCRELTDWLKDVFLAVNKGKRSCCVVLPADRGSALVLEPAVCFNTDLS